jgi:hypothetical protein
MMVARRRRGPASENLHRSRRCREVSFFARTGLGLALYAKTQWPPGAFFLELVELIRLSHVRLRTAG